MCGVFAYLGHGSIDIKKCTDVIHHRGPDSSKFKIFSGEERVYSQDPQAALAKGKKIALGFRRLSIIDLQSGSDQPFSSSDGRFHIIFNGEIYNYIEIRIELESLGHQFKTKSDTEVLLTSYIHWGTDCFRRFNGMWATCIVDFAKNKLVLSRDRFGIKPLYYYRHQHGTSIFSELKQVFCTDYEKRVNEDILRDYLESSVLDASNETLFENVIKFPQSHFSELSLDNAFNELEFTKYWDLSNIEDDSLSYVEAQERFRQLFQESIELRFRSDVPVGACLSGGLDSSSIVSFSGYLGKQITAFTVDNKDKNLSEKKWVDDVIQLYDGLSSSTVFNEEDDLSLLDKMFEIQDEPISGLGVIAQWRVMKLAKEHGVTVLLDGQGGDEILGGYRKFVFFYLKGLIRKGECLTALSEARRFLSSSEFKLFEKEGVRRYLNKTRVSSFLSEEIQGKSKIHNVGISGATDFRSKSYEDIFKYSYPQLLRYEDRNSMAFSLESRVPFLDYRLVEFVYGLPASYKIRKGYTKAILRDSLTGILPDSVRLRKSKLGFATPEKDWIESKYRKHFSDHFSNSTNPYLKTKEIATQFESNNDLDFKSKLRLFLFDKWYQFHF